MQDYAEKRIVVIGAGRSGQALVRFFCERGAQVVLTDRRRRDDLAHLAERWPQRLTLDLGGHDRRHLVGADLVVLSPGVPSDLPLLQQVRQAGIPVLGEVEIASRHLQAPLVAITGTNGKSTTTALCGEMFRSGGCKTFIGGNLGTPLIEAAATGGWQWLVVELSSFQLETIERFRPKYAMLLNISSDHLDRYDDMAAYVSAKKRIFENQGGDDVAVLNAGDRQVMTLAGGLAARPVLFSAEKDLPEGMSLDAAGNILWRWQGRELRFDTRQLLLRGRHNVENVMAAMIPPLLEGIDPKLVWRTACRFPGLPHRMQLVRRLRGVDWIDDSKGTNVGSVMRSLAGLRPPVTLIAGGKDKGGDFATLAPLVRDRVGHLLLIGEAADRIERELAGTARIVRCADMAEAVKRAAELTPAGGTVLLSPGCSSFDMFSSFEERGRVFARQVNALPEEGA
ncbi:UDP-N-acetylmuramoylalanine--D-glutamate ligase [Geothermobacter ehrlichii]|uniref:UDP-N-acetylmuramoylalanine--D-glutamate ligase n=1 Tax=Geothermobacter ehrlichii TaxID=213224 RepID=A0A5D3WF41_9BACT|nr:UDP-N-acetylmuramoyl-L-alanine--D-glutamate ligase [Geothermobacter ehrlichii]TYO96092.1 UDP-N-acetylmuramoylalanine--D-glutamate ligase [Geothermobacter ehrlichii]